MKKILMIVFLAFFLLSCSSEKKEDKNIDTSEVYIELVNKPIEIEYGSIFDPMKYVSKTNADKVETTEFSTKEVGLHEVVFKATKSRGETKDALLGLSTMEVTKDVVVIDTRPPRFLNNENNIEIYKGDKLNVDSLIKATDAVDGEINVFIQQDVDINQVGIQTMIVMAIDRNGLSTTKTISVNVKEKEPENKPESPENSSTASVQDNNQQAHYDSEPGVQQPSPQYEPAPQPTPQPSTPSQSSYSPTPMEFLFADGYSFESALSSCQAHIHSELSNGYVGMGSCNPISDSDGIYSGYKAIFY